MKALPVWLTLSLAALGVTSAQAAKVVIFEEDFNNLIEGPLADQADWLLWPSSDFGPLVHRAIEGGDGTLMAGPGAPGASGVLAAQVIVEGGFELLNEDIVTIELDILRHGSAANIPSFGIGSPNVSPPMIGSRVNGALELRGENFGTQYAALKADGTAFIRTDGELYRLRSVWDLAANAGMGSATLYFKNLTQEETEFTQLFFSDGFGGVRESVSLELFTDPIHWSRGWLRTGTETQMTYFDNIVVSVEREGVESLFAQWLAQHFTEPELADPTITGPSAAPAGDGVSNLLKYAFGLLPKEPAKPSLLPQTSIGADHLQITFFRAKTATDVELMVETSTDLMTWNSGATAVKTVNVEDLGEVERVTVRLLPMIGETSRLFGRFSGELTE